MRIGAGNRFLTPLGQGMEVGRMLRQTAAYMYCKRTWGVVHHVTGSSTGGGVQCGNTVAVIVWSPQLG